MVVPKGLGGSKGIRPHVVCGVGSEDLPWIPRSRWPCSRASAPSRAPCLQKPLKWPHFFYLLIIYPETLFTTPPCACSHVVLCLLNKIQCLKPGLSHHHPWTFCSCQAVPSYIHTAASVHIPWLCLSFQLKDAVWGWCWQGANPEADSCSRGSDLEMLGMDTSLNTADIVPDGKGAHQRRKGWQSVCVWETQSSTAW